MGENKIKNKMSKTTNKYITHCHLVRYSTAVNHSLVLLLHVNVMNVRILCISRLLPYYVAGQASRYVLIHAATWWTDLLNLLRCDRGGITILVNLKLKFDRENIIKIVKLSWIRLT